MGQQFWGRLDLCAPLQACGATPGGAVCVPESSAFVESYRWAILALSKLHLYCTVCHTAGEHIYCPSTKHARRNQTDCLNGSYQSTDVAFGVFYNVKWRLTVCEGSHNKRCRYGARWRRRAKFITCPKKANISREHTHDNTKDDQNEIKTKPEPEVTRHQTSKCLLLCRDARSVGLGECGCTAQAQTHQDVTS